MIKETLARLLRRDASTARSATSAKTRPQPRHPFPDAGPGARVVLYIEEWCSDSRKAERLVVERAWPTHREDMQNRHEEKVALFEAHGRRALPLVFVDGRFLGGLRELEALPSLDGP